MLGRKPKRLKELDLYRLKLDVLTEVNFVYGSDEKLGLFIPRYIRSLDFENEFWYTRQGYSLKMWYDYYLNRGEFNDEGYDTYFNESKHEDTTSTINKWVSRNRHIISRITNSDNISRGNQDD